MPTIIDALVVELGFDTEGMEAGRKKVEETFRKTSDSADNAGRKIDDSAKRTELYLTKLRNNVIALFAAFTAGKGIKQFVSDMTLMDSALGRAAKTMNMTTRELALMQETAKMFGIPADDLAGSFKSLNDDLLNFRLTGQSNFVPWLRSIGVAVSDANNHLLPMNDILMNLARHADTVADKPLFGAQLRGAGFSEGTIQLILQGADALKKLQDAARPLADARAADTQAAQQRLEAWNKLRNAWETTGVILLTKLTPAILAITNALTAVADFFASHPEVSAVAFSALAGALGLITLALGALAASSAWATIAGGLAAVSTVLKGIALGGAVLTEVMFPALSEAFFGLALAIEATPIGWILTGVAAISAAVYLLVTHLDDLRKAWNAITPKALHIGKEDAPSQENGWNTGLPSWLGGGKAAPGSSGGGSALDQAAGLLRGFEGFQESAKWDVNAFRAGYGSDTVTDPNTGAISRVTAGTRVTRAQAEADLKRRVAETARMAEKAIGTAWSGLSENAKAAIISTAYNYGHVPGALIAAAQTGNNDKIGAAIKSLKGANNGINANRREAEARIASGGDSAGAAAINKALSPGSANVPSAGASTSAQVANVANDNRASKTSTVTSETKVAQLNVYSSARDAAPIAGDIKSALERDDFVQQANYGPA